MSFNLIAKNKIATLIKEDPTAKIACLAFLQEFEYLAQKILDRTLSFEGSGQITCTQSLSRDYIAEFLLYGQFKTAIICWVGTKEHHVLYQAEKVKVLRARYGNAKTVTVQIVKSGGKVTTKVSPDTQPLPPNLKDAVAPQPAIINALIKHERDSRNFTLLHTNVEYENALERVALIFTAGAETPEILELSALLPAIKQYEDSHFTFPDVHLLDVIKLKMEQFGYLPGDFSRLIGSQEKTDLFFAGKLKLSNWLLKKLCQRVGIRYPVDNAPIF